MESLLTKWRKALYHSVFESDKMYETVMDLIFRREKPFFRSKRLKEWLTELTPAKQKQFERLVSKSELFEIHQGYLCFRWTGAPPWVFSDRTRERQILQERDKETVFRVVRPSQVDTVLREAYLCMEDSGMTGYQSMYYHLIAVKKLMGITQRRILLFLRDNPYHQMVRTIATVEKSIAPFRPETLLEQFQLDITDLKIPKARSKVPYTISLCVVIDIFSRLCWVKALDSTKQAPIIDFLQETVFAEGDVPKRLQTDNGPQMDNATFRDFLAKYGVHHFMSDPYRPQSNGFVEQKHHTIKTRVYSYYTQQREANPSYSFVQFKKDLPLLLQQVEYSINNSIIRSIRMTPFNIHRGFQHGSDWSEQRFQPADITDFTTERRPPSSVFPKVHQAFFKELQEKKKTEPKNAFQVYDQVKVGIVYKGEKGYHQMVVVYPYTHDLVEHVVFPKAEGSLRPSEFISKTMTIFSWSKTNFKIHDIDDSGHLPKLYLRDPQNRPVIRKVKDGVGGASRYLSFFHPWMLMYYQGVETREHIRRSRIV